MISIHMKKLFTITNHLSILLTKEMNFQSQICFQHSFINAPSPLYTTKFFLSFLTYTKVKYNFYMVCIFIVMKCIKIFSHLALKLVTLVQFIIHFSNLWTISEKALDTKFSLTITTRKQHLKVLILMISLCQFQEVIILYQNAFLCFPFLSIINQLSYMVLCK